MEEYLQYMKTFCSQMNDVEHQAAKISVQEQMHVAKVRSLEQDINSAKSEMRLFKEATKQMVKAKGEICAKILERQRRTASLESDSCTLTQTLELIRQEKIGLSTKLMEKRIYYSKVVEDMSAKLQKQQEWFSSNKTSTEMKEHELVKEKNDGKNGEIEGKASAGDNLIIDNKGSDSRKNFSTQLDSAKSRLDEILCLKCKLHAENDKIKQAIEAVKSGANDYKLQLEAADIRTLEEEYNALLSDKAGENEFLQSLEIEIEKIKGVSHVIKCACGKEYTVAVNK
ncbi:hypothetical protein L6164_026044 [Bauhinia variegata]|uniref:Uncharacterized protein n=1 Tax=Bauhinia variegata TaxID=167791 RepID=A0ACB9M3G7_BAUVA|nr:hypothetical protein L6164_026044 [Bauhinia variegata]